jgi:hypothetical protein
MPLRSFVDLDDIQRQALSGELLDGLKSIMNQDRPWRARGYFFHIITRCNFMIIRILHSALLPVINHNSKYVVNSIARHDYCFLIIL